MKPSKPKSIIQQLLSLDPKLPGDLAAEIARDIRRSPKAFCLFCCFHNGQIQVAQFEPASSDRGLWKPTNLLDGKQLNFVQKVKASGMLDDKTPGPRYNETPTPASALSTQVGGSHYKGLAIQPAEYCQKNRLPYCESSVIQYVTRHREKNGRQDIEKAIHCLQLLLEIEYPLPVPGAKIAHGQPGSIGS